MCMFFFWLVNQFCYVDVLFGTSSMKKFKDSVALASRPFQPLAGFDVM